MGKSIWEILSPFTKVEPSEEKKEEAPAEENNEEAPAEENNAEAPAEENTEEAPAEENNAEAPAEENTEEAPAEENNEEAPAEENNEEAPAEENNEEAPAEENNEEAPAEENNEEAPAEENNAEAPAEGNNEEAPPDEPLLFRIIHKLMGYKFIVDLCKFIMIVVVGILLVLIYGQILKTEGCPSFETIFSTFEANRLCDDFLKGDMDKLVSKVHILTPTDSYKKDWEDDFRSDIAASLSSLFQEKKLGKLAQKKNVACEYQKDKISGTTHLVYTCQIQITSKEEMKLVLQKDGKNKFQISASSKGKNKSTLETMTSYFSYLSNGYIRASDYAISSMLCENKEKDYMALADYFYKNANKSSKNNVYGKELAKKFSNLLSNDLVLTEAVFTPYEYTKKTRKLSTCFILRFKNATTNASAILYQPLTVGLYGYNPVDTAQFYSDYMDETTAAWIRDLF